MCSFVSLYMFLYMVLLSRKDLYLLFYWDKSCFVYVFVYAGLHPICLGDRGENATSLLSLNMEKPESWEKIKKNV